VVCFDPLDAIFYKSYVEQQFLRDLPAWEHREQAVTQEKIQEPLTFGMQQGVLGLVFQPNSKVERIVRYENWTCYL
jgi:hypothetical protein